MQYEKNIDKSIYILQELECNPDISQKSLADKIGISVGLINIFIKRLTKKGFLKIKRINGKSLSYLLTPTGIAEKTKLTKEYFQFSINHYKNAKNMLIQKFTDYQKKDLEPLIIYTTPEWAEICYTISNYINFKIDGFLIIPKIIDKIIDIPVYSIEQVQKFDKHIIGIGEIEKINNLKIDYILESSFSGIY